MEINPYQPPSAVPVSMPGGDQLAGYGARLVAVIIESLTLLPITLPLAFAMGNFDGILEGRQPPLLNTIAMTVLGYGVFVAINWVFLKNGQTIGKRAMGIRIVALDGSVLPVGRLLTMRYLPWWITSVIPVIGGILVLIDALFIFRHDRRCIHDHIAGTKVVAVTR